jgi:hypothetical protein
MAEYELYLQPPKIRIRASSQVKCGLVINSHERSGTHFLMNSLESCTRYTAHPYLDYDTNPLAGLVSFYSKQSASAFFSRMTQIRASGDALCITSLVKSHFPADLLADCTGSRLRLVYIYRNPVDTIMSLWRFFLRFPNEGPCLQSPLDLAMATPERSSQRYQ